ncbi:MAG: D-alanine--D-alanine ligase family protein [Candidatus Tyrphobacter sp.]
MSERSRKERIAVIMGGRSSEREISIASGTLAKGALEALGFETHSLDYDERFVDAIRAIAPDAVFNALHGTGGEDGQVQGVLAYLGIPFTGSELEGCALAMDKHLTKKLIAAEGLPTPVWDLFDLRGGALPLLAGSLDPPLVLKPRFEGSSVGVSIVRTHEEWSSAVLAASKTYGEMIAEEYVDGREFACGVFGDQSLPVVEIIANVDDFYSYHAKYDAGGSTHVTPAQIDDDLAIRLQTLALSVHKLLGLRDYSRTDIVVNEQGRPYILEVNTLPGITPTSLLPDACAAAGITYEAMVGRLVAFALDRR